VGLGQDVRQAVRVWRRSPAFAAVATAVIALGIGGGTTIFSVANALVLNPFPYPDAGRLVAVDLRYGGGPWFTTVATGSFMAWRDRNTVFDAITAYGWGRPNVTGHALPDFEGPQRLIAGHATSSFLRVLDVRPALGRYFSADEDRPGSLPVVVLGYGFWQRQFAGRPDVLGRTLGINGRAHTIVGVMPPYLPLPGMPAPELWTPAPYGSVDPPYADTTQWTGDTVIARLRPGVTRTAAESQLNALLRARALANPAFARQRVEARVSDIGHDIRADAEVPVAVLAAVVCAILLLACLNLAGLLLARGAARTRDIAVRASLGASRGRLIRETLTETVVLSLGGGLLGILVASWGVRAAAAAAPVYLGLTTAVRLDLPVLGFAFALSVMTGLLFGLLPAWQGSKTDLNVALKGGLSLTPGGRRGRTLSLLVVTEIALAAVLLADGGLLVKSFAGLLRTNTGLRTDHLLTFELALDQSRYDSAAAKRHFSSALLERIRAIAGVRSAAAVDPLPMSRQFSGGSVEVDGREVTKNGQSTQYLSASAGYFQAMGIPVLVGREFTEADERGGPPIAVVNEAFVRAFLPGADPLAHTIGLPPGRGTGTAIVGVVGNIRHNGPAQPPNPQLYRSLGQFPRRSFGIAVRTAVPSAAVVPAVRAAVRALDSDLPLDRVRTMDEMVAGAIAQERLITLTVFGFALFALSLASIGLFGVMAYAVSRRTGEFGVRMALGASPRSVSWLVLRQALWLVSAGVAVGVPVTLATSHALASLLFGVGVRDPMVLLGAIALLIIVSSAAAYLPARRATTVDPLQALRSE
jgi:predicted permease